MSTSAVDALVDRLIVMAPTQLEAWVRTLEPADQNFVAEAMHQRMSRRWRADPASFAHHLTKGVFRLWRVTRYLSAKAVDAVEGRSTRQIWLLPSRYGKTQLASRWLPAWALDRDPSMAIILASYADALAEENGGAVRDILAEHADKLNVSLRPDRKARDRWTTEQGGGLLAAGIGSGIIGFGARGIVLDDLLKNWQEAHSPAKREAVWNWYRSTARTRLDDEAGWIIYVTTRMHAEDPVAQLRRAEANGEGEHWEIVRLPAIAETPNPNDPDPLLRLPDPLGRTPGEPLEPERFPLEAVQSRHRVLGSYLTACMEQQRPVPEEGGEFKRTWFRLEDAMPTHADAWCSSWDLKLKDKEAGDYVVGQVWARTGADFWMMDQLRGQWGTLATKLAIALLAVRWPQVNHHYVEFAGNADEVVPALKRKNPGFVIDEALASRLGMTVEERTAVQMLIRNGIPGLILKSVTEGSKPVRARAISGLIEAGNVHLFARAPWLGVYLDEWAAFPKGSYDDQVDTTTQALARLDNRGSGNEQSGIAQLVGISV